MYRRSSPLFFLCETPTHVGSGSELGIVDLPIQREKHSGFPKFEASSIKGAIRQAFEQTYPYKLGAIWEDEAIKIQRVFGFDEHTARPEDKNQLKELFKKSGKSEPMTEYAACVGFSDARLLLFPVKSMRGVFAWVTCPQILERFIQDLTLSNVDISNLPKSTELGKVSVGKCFVTEGSDLLIPNRKTGGKSIVLEEYVFEASPDSKLKQLAQWLSKYALQNGQDYRNTKLSKNLVLVSDDDFNDFVNLSTEVITRTRIDNWTGTVAGKALFTEEYLPSESLLYCLLLSTDEFRDKKDTKSTLSEEEVLDFLNQKLSQTSIQIGGNATLGKGIVSTKLNKGNKS